ncbi:hypothetical protein EES41_01905 [Streptomyces sp. ADI95-16]|nr:hypothetical protein EES41_01905 [Streptomyces sp. ADI95-16]
MGQGFFESPVDAEPFKGGGPVAEGVGEPEPFASTTSAARASVSARRFRWSWNGDRVTSRIHAPSRSSTCECVNRAMSGPDRSSVARSNTPEAANASPDASAAGSTGNSKMRTHRRSPDLHPRRRHQGHPYIRISGR